jgi:hypothetical protein
MALPHAFMTSYPHAHITPGSTYAYTPTCPSVFTSTPPHAHTPTHRHPPRDEANSRVGATRNAMPFNGQETRKTKIERSRIYSEAIRLEQTRRAVCARVRSDLIPTRPHTKNPHQNNPMSGFYAYTMAEAGLEKRKPHYPLAHIKAAFTPAASTARSSQSKEPTIWTWTTTRW